MVRFGRKIKTNFNSRGKCNWFLWSMLSQQFCFFHMVVAFSNLSCSIFTFAIRFSPILIFFLFVHFIFEIIEIAVHLLYFLETSPWLWVRCGLRAYCAQYNIASSFAPNQHKYLIFMVFQKWFSLANLPWNKLLFFFDRKKKEIHS